jgi:single-strand DNA-binding protein
MSSLNKVTIIGNVGRDPEIRSTKVGKEVASFSMACTQYWRDKEGEKKSSTEWIPVVVFSAQVVDIIKKYVKKGSKLYIVGTWTSRKWVDKEGVERVSIEVVINGFDGQILLLDSKSASDTQKQNTYGQDDAYDINDTVPF